MKNHIINHTVILATALGLMAGCASESQTAGLRPLSSPGSKFAVLPDAVQRTVTAMGGAQEIKDINKVPILGRQDVYEVEFSNPVINPDLYVALDGSLVKTNLPPAMPTLTPAPKPIEPPLAVPALTPTSGPPPTLPAAVQRALQYYAPDAVVASVVPAQHTVYVVTFAGPNPHLKMMIADDGTVLREH